MNAQTKVRLAPDTSRIYNAILRIMADRKSKSSSIKTDLIMRTARFGFGGVQDAQTTLHTSGLVDIELEEWNEAEPTLSRFRYTLPVATDKQ